MRDIFRLSLIVLLLFLFTGGVLIGQNTTRSIGEPSVLVEFDTTRLNKYLENPEYRYQRRAPESSWLRRMWSDFMDYLEGLFREGTGITERILTLLLIVGAVLVLAYFFLRSRFESLFARGDRRRKSSMRILNEDVLVASLADQINSALNSGDYRSAYRWTYLNLLRHLDQAGLLRLHGDKTNRDYQREISKTPVRSEFLILAEAFDFTWYGDYPIDREAFDRYSLVADNILTQLDKT